MRRIVALPVHLARGSSCRQEYAVAQNCTLFAEFVAAKIDPVRVALELVLTIHKLVRADFLDLPRRLD